jgi:hypothetical protein
MATINQAAHAKPSYSSIQKHSAADPRSALARRINPLNSFEATARKNQRRGIQAGKSDGLGGPSSGFSLIEVSILCWQLADVN